MNEPDLSVILVNWNTAELLLSAVGSLFLDAEESGASVQVIVVDNGSSDDSVGRVRSCHPECVAIENDSNLGFARAVNKGLAVAEGRHVILLNTDARVQQGALRSILETLNRSSDVGIAGGLLLNPDGSAQNSFAPFPSLATEIVNKSVLKLIWPDRYRRKPNAEEVDLIDVDSVIGACLVIRGETLAEIGPLDERFFFFFEETDWCYQARKHGWRVVVDPKVRVEHGQGESSKPVLADARIEFYRSRYRYFLKNHGTGHTVLLFAGMLAKLTVEVVSAVCVSLLFFCRSQQWNRRLRVVATLLVWHLLACPKSWGLEGRFGSVSSQESTDREP